VQLNQYRLPKRRTHHYDLDMWSSSLQGLFTADGFVSTGRPAADDQSVL
jgi:hypothetical protein